jgi:hypothetical protein
VEAFEGTNAAILRGGELGKKGAVMVKVSKPNQDLRFDVPVIGPQTLETAVRARLRAIGVESGLTLLLDPAQIQKIASKEKITVVGL